MVVCESIDGCGSLHGTERLSGVCIFMRKTVLRLQPSDYCVCFAEYFAHQFDLMSSFLVRLLINAKRINLHPAVMLRVPQGA